MPPNAYRDGGPRIRCPPDTTKTNPPNTPLRCRPKQAKHDNDKPGTRSPNNNNCAFPTPPPAPPASLSTPTQYNLSSTATISVARN